MRKVKMYPLLFSLLICLSAGLVGSVFTYQAIPTWYVTLTKPSFNPPNWVFGPVWTMLYVMMGISLSIVWKKRSKKPEKRSGLLYFSLQLILNALWSIVFFGMHSPLAALFVIVGLWAFIFSTIRNFLVISKIAGWLLIPYLLWVGFATLLNLSIVILNH